METETRVRRPHNRECWHYQKLQEANKKPPLGPAEEAMPALGHGLLAVRTVREYMSVVLGHQVCGHLGGHPKETKRGGHSSSSSGLSDSLHTAHFHPQSKGNLRALRNATEKDRQ